MTIDGLSIGEWAARIHNTNAAARFLNVKPQTMALWRMKRSDGPVYIQIGGNRIGYRGQALLDYVDQRQRRSTSDFPRAA